jgi:hypothetical protein
MADDNKTKTSAPFGIGDKVKVVEGPFESVKHLAGKSGTVANNVGMIVVDIKGENHYFFPEELKLTRRNPRKVS